MKQHKFEIHSRHCKACKIVSWLLVCLAEAGLLSHLQSNQRIILFVGSLSPDSQVTRINPTVCKGKAWLQSLTKSLVTLKCCGGRLLYRVSATKIVTISDAMVRW